MKLSERQREVLDLLCEGLTDKRIAKRLDISPGTVKVHVGRLFLKMRVHNRLQAVAKALKP